MLIQSNYRKGAKDAEKFLLLWSALRTLRLCGKNRKLIHSNYRKGAKDAENFLLQWSALRTLRLCGENRKLIQSNYRKGAKDAEKFLRCGRLCALCDPAVKMAC